MNKKMNDELNTLRWLFCGDGASKCEMSVIVMGSVQENTGTRSGTHSGADMMVQKLISNIKLLENSFKIFIFFIINLALLVVLI